MKEYPSKYESLEEILRAALAYVDENWVPEEPEAMKAGGCYSMASEPLVLRDELCYGSAPKAASKKRRRKKPAEDEQSAQQLICYDDAMDEGALPDEARSAPIPMMPGTAGRERKSRYGDRYDPEHISAVMGDRLSDGYMAGVGQELNQAVDLTFSEKLATVISERDLRDVDVYKAAHIDRKLFSKIINDRDYNPSRDTVLALAFGLNMNLEETDDLLKRAGLAISHSSRRDVLIEYFLREGIHNLDVINDALYRLHEKTIGK